MRDETDLPNWFNEPGAYVLVDGQFGSTGKGLMAGWLAEHGGSRITHVTTNAGPNSGHTAYFDHGGKSEVFAEPAATQAQFQKIVTQQIPVASVFLKKMGNDVITLLNAGAIIDEGILLDEFSEHGFNNNELFIHPSAAVITAQDRYDDQQVVKGIAGTGKGIGPAIARKIMRSGGALARNVYRPMLPVGMADDLSFDRFWDWSKDVVLVETAQGFSLGLNSQFHPHVTSRECTVTQAIADARIPAQRVKGVVACFRTYPIRVGNVESAHSGDCYGDQMETSWEALGLEPELTTVTKRVRRVFTWSRRQFKDCIAANEPDVLFINFMNYLNPGAQTELLGQILLDYKSVTGRNPARILGGFGPHSHDIQVLL